MARLNHRPQHSSLAKNSHEAPIQAIHHLRAIGPPVVRDKESSGWTEFCHAWFSLGWTSCSALWFVLKTFCRRISIFSHSSIEKYESLSACDCESPLRYGSLR